MEKSKLEIGAGNSPNRDETWIHQDIRKLPGIDLVCDARHIPYPDSSFTDIFASHVIEHFKWREVKGVLIEWLRVLAINGKLEIITPDFYRLWGNLILKRELPKSDKWKGGPIDSAFVAYVTGGGQDYPENTHMAHYTPDWYKRTLEQLNCKVTLIYHGQSHPSPSVRIIAIKL